MATARDREQQLTNAGRALLAYVSIDTARLDDAWRHGEEAGVVGAAFALAARAKFGASPDPSDVALYVSEKRRHDPTIDPLAAEAAIRVSLDQVEVLQGLPQGLLARGMLSTLRPLARDTYSESSLVEWILDAQSNLSEILQSDVLNQFVEDR